MTQNPTSSASPLPADLIDRYRGWLSSNHAPNADRFRQLADEGQEPHSMVISCCDSRVQPTDLFGASPGELFMHRSIASLVPSRDAAASGQTGTAAAVQYAVQALGIGRIVVIGHSQCGGVKGCHDMCSGAAPALEEPGNYVGNWIEILRPAYGRIKDVADESQRLQSFEKEAVKLSLENLLTFDFVKDAVDAGSLTLHGLWIDIGSGRVEMFDGAKGEFVAA